MDDVINISGHRLGTAEIEDCMVRRSDKVCLSGVSFSCFGQWNLFFVIGPCFI